MRNQRNHMIEEMEEKKIATRKACKIGEWKSKKKIKYMRKNTARATLFRLAC